MFIVFFKFLSDEISYRIIKVKHLINRFRTRNLTFSNQGILYIYIFFFNLEDEHSPLLVE